MRFFRGVLAAAAVIGLAACSDDDGNGGVGPGDGDQIDATYELVSVDGEGVPATFPFSDGTNTFELTFESGSIDLDDDGTFQASRTVSAEGDDEQFTASGTYEIGDGEIALTSGSLSVTGSIDGNSITYTDPDFEVELVFER
jgi:hypothetical protein